MRMKTLLLSSALCFPIAAVYAADMPAKAQPPAPQAPTTPTPISYPTWNGWYGGIGAFGETASSSIQTSAGTTNLNTAGAGLKGVFGYQYRLGSDIGFTEFDIDYTNLGGTATLLNGSSGSVSGPWGMSLTTAVGANWLMLLQAPFNLIGGQSPQELFPALPNGVTAVSSLPYVSLSADFNDIQGNVSGIGGNSQWQVTPAPGFGILTTLSNGTAIDTRFKYEFSNTSLPLGPGTAAQKGGTLWFEATLKM